MRNQKDFDSLRSHAPGDAVDRAIAVAARAGDVGPVHPRLAGRGVVATHAGRQQNDLARLALKSLAQAAIHDLGRDHVEVVFDRRPAAENLSFAPAAPAMLSFSAAGLRSNTTST